MTATGEFRSTSRRGSVWTAWRTVGVGLIGLAGGLFMAGSIGAGGAPTEVASVVIDTETSSGRWSSTLIAVMENGDIMYLDTSRPRSEWRTYKYSPSFSGKQ